MFLDILVISVSISVRREPPGLKYLMNFVIQILPPKLIKVERIRKLRAILGGLK